MVKDYDYNIIIVSGFICTGSSAMIDVLRSNSSFVVVEEEFNLFKHGYGLYKLIQSIITADRERERIYRFCRKKLLEAGKTPSKYYHTKRKILQIISGNNRLLKKERASFDRIFNGEYINKTKILFDEFDRIIKYNQVSENALPDIKKIMSNYFQSLALSVDVKREADTIIFNQTIKPSQETKLGLDVLDNTKLIVVDRDPRDQYIDLKLTGRLDHIVQQQTNNSDDEIQVFSRWYKRKREDFYKHNSNTDRLLIVRFEDLVLHYDETLKTLSSFLNDHANVLQYNRTYFDPEIAVEKLGMWKDYENYDAMEIIHEELADYCYDRC